MVSIGRRRDRPRRRGRLPFVKIVPFVNLYTIAGIGQVFPKEELNP